VLQCDLQHALAAYTFDGFEWTLAATLLSGQKFEWQFKKQKEAYQALMVYIALITVTIRPIRPPNTQPQTTNQPKCLRIIC
jgi:hypothetical protein